jgi:hypothetical protein
MSVPRTIDPLLYLTRVCLAAYVDLPCTSVALLTFRQPMLGLLGLENRHCPACSLLLHSCTSVEGLC